MKRATVLVLLVFCMLPVFAGGGKEQAPAVGPAAKKTYKIGYTALGENSIFFKTVKTSLFAAAEKHGVQITYTINDRDPQKQRLAIDTFVLQECDFILDFTVLTESGNAIAKELKAKGKPMMSIDCLYEDAYFFGVNNYDAGYGLGTAFASEIKKRWGGKVDAVLELYAEANGKIVRQRTSAAVEALSKNGIAIDGLLTSTNINSPGSNQTDVGYVKQLVVDYLTAHPNNHKIAIIGMTDEMSLAALAALEAQGRTGDALIASHNADVAALPYIKSGKSPFIMSQHYNPAGYGENIVKAIIDILDGKKMDQKIYNPVEPVTFENIAVKFPNVK